MNARYAEICREQNLSRSAISELRITQPQYDMFLATSSPNGDRPTDEVPESQSVASLTFVGGSAGTQNVAFKPIDFFRLHPVGAPFKKERKASSLREVQFSQQLHELRRERS